MQNRELRLEALSAILGCPVKFHKDSQENKLAGAKQSLLQPQDIISITSPLDFLSGKLPLSHTKGGAIPSELLIEEKFFDTEHDRDFTCTGDEESKPVRGGEQYSRPYGWKRYALRVLGKYEDGDGWLEKEDSAWPVSYHGTSKEGARDIIRGRYKAGPREAYGRGIYSTPNVGVASKYTTRFESKRTKKTYDVILQNRINPKNRKEVTDDYWLVPIPKGTSTDEEEKISKNSIRPYGLLLREVKDS